MPYSYWDVKGCILKSPNTVCNSVMACLFKSLLFIHNNFFYCFLWSIFWVLLDDHLGIYTWSAALPLHHTHHQTPRSLKYFVISVSKIFKPVPHGQVAGAPFPTIPWTPPVLTLQVLTSWWHLLSAEQWMCITLHCPASASPPLLLS